MDNLNTLSEDDLIKLILDLAKNLKELEAEVLRLKKIVESL